MRRAIRRIRSGDGHPTLPHLSLYPILASRMDSAHAYREALMLELELRPRIMLNAFARILTAASITLLIIHLLTGIQVWPVQLLLVGIYLIASAAARRLISGPVTFITLVASALLGWI